MIEKEGLMKITHHMKISPKVLHLDLEMLTLSGNVFGESAVLTLAEVLK
jgi:hypothetical protein